MSSSALKGDTLPIGLVPKWKVAFVIRRKSDNTWRDSDVKDPREHAAITGRLTRDAVWKVLQDDPPPESRVTSKRIAIGIDRQDIKAALALQDDEWQQSDSDLPKYIKLVELKGRGVWQNVNWYDVNVQEDLDEFRLDSDDHERLAFDSEASFSDSSDGEEGIQSGDGHSDASSSAVSQ